MERRNVLRASGGTLAVALAGCIAEINSGEPATTKADEATTDAHTTTTAEETTEARETTNTTTTVGPAETQYDLGTAHDHAEWRFAVVEFELTKQFQTDDGESYEMSDGTKLGIGTIEVENRTSEKRGWSGVPLAAIFDGRAYEKQRGFDHPAFSDSVPMDELKRVETARQYAPSAYPVEPGETVTTWELFTLPEGAIRDEISAGFDGAPDDDAAYPVRWTLN